MSEKAPLPERAREAFAAYRGLGREIIDELIFALVVANREVERLNAELAGERGGGAQPETNPFCGLPESEKPK